MRDRVADRVNRHLDEQLGMWTRLLPWRREIAVHIEEAYRAARAEAHESEGDTAFLQEALAAFGDVQDVASQLRREHWPQHVVLRIIAVVFSAWIIFYASGAGPWTFLSLPALCFTLGAAMAFVVLDACRGSSRWEHANRVGTWGALCGVILSTTALFANMADPNQVGIWMSHSILTALYCVVFLAPRRPIVVALVSLAVVDMGLVWFSLVDFATMDSTVTFGVFLRDTWGGVDRSYMLRVLAICGACVCAGVARFGLHGVARHASSIAAATFLLSLATQIIFLCDPSTLPPHFFVAICVMLLALACSLCVSDSSRLVRRILR